jgi:hypothetical protein
MREVIAEYTAEEVYSTKRQEIQERILGRSEAMMGKKSLERTAEQSEYGEHYQIPLDKMINLYDTLVLGMELPAPVVAAINRKVEQYYLVQEYAFRVERERKESERKIIEAQGISEFQRIVSQGISDSYVRWRGIEATLQLAQSPNSKIVVIGSGKDGLPIILGNVDTPLPPPAATPADGAAAPKQTTAAPTPARPLEKTPAVNLPTPPEITPAAGTGTADQKAVAGAPSQQPAANTPEQRSFWQRGLTELESMFSRAIRPIEPQLKGPFDKPVVQ